MEVYKRFVRTWYLNKKYNINRIVVGSRKMLCLNDLSKVKLILIEFGSLLCLHLYLSLCSSRLSFSPFLSACEQPNLVKRVGQFPTLHFITASTGFATMLMFLLMDRRSTEGFLLVKVMSVSLWHFINAAQKKKCNATVSVKWHGGMCIKSGPLTYKGLSKWHSTNAALKSLNTTAWNGLCRTAAWIQLPIIYTHDFLLPCPFSIKKL